MTNALIWALTHKRAVAEAFLVATIVAGGWMYNRQQRIMADEKAKAEGLAADLREKITFAHNELERISRDAEGKVIVKRVYVPPEGSVVVTQKEQAALQAKMAELADKLAKALAKGDQREADRLRDEMGHAGDVDVVVKDKGFTLKPGFGFDWANHGLKPRVDLKWAYWGRYSLLIGGSENGIGPDLSRHIDDIMWGHPQNVEIFIGYKILRFEPGSSTIAGGLRANF